VTLNEFVLRLAEPGIEPITMHTAGRHTKDIQVKQQGADVKQTEESQAIEQPTDVEQEPPSELGPGSPIADPYKESASGEFVSGMTIDIGSCARYPYSDKSSGRGFWPQCSVTFSRYGPFVKGSKPG